ncbi:hypothetical protein NDU88_004396 [Pleurodeles waltl]|uniref:Uncharacterized protein n=1 Tax=Pleurodeles waltl TaxID=8319 RepID=A0AAV7UG19_PLEWA|nr:hypothetical protein NDU88_004396 [Pleurodeles waltl]
MNNNTVRATVKSCSGSAGRTGKTQIPVINKVRNLSVRRFPCPTGATDTRLNGRSDRIIIRRLRERRGNRRRAVQEEKGDSIWKRR